MTCSVTRDRGVPAPTGPLDALAHSASAPPVENVAPPILVADVPDASDEIAAPPAPAGPLPRTPGHELDNFYAALRRLDRDAKVQPRPRSGHVRVAWLGDSHGASDLWSGPLRAALQARFGDGGLGFVHVGYKAYRHEGVKMEVKGRWALIPRQPATSSRTGDGVFGLGGVLFAGSSDDPRVAITVTDAALPPQLNWDFCYKLSSPNDEIGLTVTGVPDRTLASDPADPPGLLHHLTFTTTTASPTMHVVPKGGQPAFCGVIVETDPKTQPGVVLDTLGINGARLTTPLAWSDAAWIAEASRRPPALVIVEYGTNEASDHVIRTEAFVENLRRLMARVHEASPASDCLVLAPTDRADTLETMPLVRDALHDAARASSCGFWDTYAAMGGKASIVAWRAETPPRAAPDGVHLTPRGYHDLGEHLATDVLAGYVP